MEIKTCEEYVLNKLKEKEEACTTLINNFQNLVTECDKLTSNLNAVQTKFDMLIAFLRTVCTFKYSYDNVSYIRFTSIPSVSENSNPDMYNLLLDILGRDEASEDNDEV